MVAGHLRLNSLRSSRFLSHTKIILAGNARALFQETLILGRSGERGGRLRARLEAHRDGFPLLIEDLDLTDDTMAGLPGILGHNRVLSTTALLGVHPEASSNPQETVLAEPGALTRILSTNAHLGQAALQDTWRRWSDLVTPWTPNHPAKR